MKNSPSTASASSAWRLAAWCALALLIVVAWPGHALAGRKRLVVLELTGPKAEQFQRDLEKALKKKHSVVSRKKWQAAADELGAVKLTDKNVQRIAGQINVDGVIVGKVEKRGSRYLVHLQLRAGASGKVIAKPEIVERQAGLGAEGRDTIDEELMPIIDDLPALGSDDEDDDEDVDDRPAKVRGKGKPSKGKIRDDDAVDDDDRGGRSGWGRGRNRDDDDADLELDDDEAPVAKVKGKSQGKTPPKGKGKVKAPPPDDDDAVDEDEDDDRAGRGRGRGRGRDDADSDDARDDEDDDRVADRDDEDDRDDRRDDDDDDERERGAPHVGDRPALDLAAGLSFTGRRLSFTTNLTANAPQGYQGAPVPGLRITADAFPLALNKQNRSFTRNLGVQVLFDRVLKISSTLNKDGMSYTLPTVEQHLAFGVVYRHPVSKQLSIEGSLRFNKRKFVIDKGPAPMPTDVDIPNTDYSYIDPGVGLGYAIAPKMAIGADARFLFITSTGEMSQADQYGGATVTGVDLQANFDYKVAPKWLVRASAGFATIGFAFKGNGDLTNNRDGDATSVDVSGARDSYFGGSATAAYVF